MITLDAYRRYLIGSRNVVFGATSDSDSDVVVRYDEDRLVELGARPSVWL